MNAKKCDRCKSYYDDNTKRRSSFKGFILKGLWFSTINGNTTHYNDLCDDCLDELELFLGGRKLTEVKLEKPKEEESTNENL